MENLNLILYICIFVPIFVALFIFRKETRVSHIFYMVGICVCLYAGEVNGRIADFFGNDMLFLTVNITPLVEEVSKSIPILFYIFCFRPRRQTILECSVMTGIGFSVLENAYDLASNIDAASISWALIRVFGASMVHCVCTLCVGYMMSFVYVRRKMFFTGTLAALAVATVYHSVYNMVIQSPYRNLGVLFPILTYIPLLIHIRRKSGKRLWI